MVADFSMGYEERPREKTLSVFMNAAAREMSSVELTMDFDAYQLPVRELAMGQFRPRLKAATLVINDDSLMDRISAHCTESGELRAEEVTDAHLEHFVEVMSESGIVPDEPLLAAYRDYVDSPGTFVMTAAPRQPVDLTQLQFYKSSDVPDLLNLNARVE